MPYITKERRTHLVAEQPETVGELNYALTKVMLGYVARKGLSYSALNDCLGAVEGAKLELYRRLAVPYEDGKILENGDVYDSPATAGNPR
jgi:hypothetical protein